MTTFPQARRRIVNAVAIADDGANGLDPPPSDNTATDTDTPIAAPDLTLTKTDTDGVTEVRRGGSVTYTFAYANAGGQDATGSDILPAGTSFDPALNPGWMLSGGTLTFTVGALRAGTSGGAATLILGINGVLPAGVIEHR